MDQQNISRREFISTMGVGLAAMTIGLAGCAPKEIVKEVPVEITKEVTRIVPDEKTVEVPQEIPPSPWEYAELDIETVRKYGHARYYEGDCCYGAFSAIVEALKERVGFPFTQIPTAMMLFGAGGVAGWGTTCGSLIGASAAINLVTEADVAKKLVDELMNW